MTKLQITNRLLLSAAEKLGWAHRIVDEDGGMIAITPPSRREIILKSSAHPDARIAQYFMAEKKQVFHRLASGAGVPVPASVEYDGSTNIPELIEEWGSIVVKPQDASHGNGVTIGCSSENQVVHAIEQAQEFSDSILLQQQVQGNDYRVLVIGDDVVAVTRRRPAFVIGDGISSVEQLIIKENGGTTRAEGYSEKMNYINVDGARAFLGDKIQDVPQEGEEYTVLNVPNIGQGGQAINETEKISSLARQLALDAARVVGLRCAGVDFLSPDISSSDKGDFVVIEVNAIPSFSMHQLPHVGDPIDVSTLFLEEIAK